MLFKHYNCKLISLNLSDDDDVSLRRQSLIDQINRPTVYVDLDG